MKLCVVTGISETSNLISAVVVYMQSGHDGSCKGPAAEINFCMEGLQWGKHTHTNPTEISSLEVSAKAIWLSSKEMTAKDKREPEQTKVTRVNSQVLHCISPEQSGCAEIHGTLPSIRTAYWVGSHTS